MECPEVVSGVSKIRKGEGCLGLSKLFSIVRLTIVPEQRMKGPYLWKSASLLLI